MFYVKICLEAIEGTNKRPTCTVASPLTLGEEITSIQKQITLFGDSSELNYSTEEKIPSVKFYTCTLNQIWNNLFWEPSTPWPPSQGKVSNRKQRSEIFYRNSLPVFVTVEWQCFLPLTQNTFFLLKAEILAH